MSGLARARVTFAIVAATAAISFYVLLSGRVGITAVLGGFTPARFAGLTIPPFHGAPVPAVLTPLTATLLHAGVGHLGFNMAGLAFAGALTERALGGRGLAVLYVAGAYAAALGQWFPNPLSTVPMIGASGAVSAVVAAYALLYGRRRTRTLGPGRGAVVHAAWLALAWIGLQVLVEVAGFGGGRVAVGAHIGGFLAGLALAGPLFAMRSSRIGRGLRANRLP